MYKDIVKARRMNEARQDAIFVHDDEFNSSVIRIYNRIPIHFTSDDKRNIRNIAVVLEALAAKWSDYIDDHPEAMDTDTDAFIKQLSFIPQKWSGTWDDEIVF